MKIKETKKGYFKITGLTNKQMSYLPWVINQYFAHAEKHPYADNAEIGEFLQDLMDELFFFEHCKPYDEYPN